MLQLSTMRMMPVILRSTLTSFVTLWLLSSCSWLKGPPQEALNSPSLEDLLSKTQDSQSATNIEKEFKQSLYVFKTSDERELKLRAAQKMADLSLRASNYLAADTYLNFVVRAQPFGELRWKALQKRADNSYYNLKKYKKAIYEYKTLLAQRINWVSNQLMVIRSYFNLGEFSQVHVEVQTLYGADVPEAFLFEALLTKANSYFADGDFDQASQEFKGILDSYPKLSTQNHIGLNYALSLEEQGKVPEAISVLEELKPNYHSPSFIQGKIDHLLIKLNQLPGNQRLGR